METKTLINNGTVSVSILPVPPPASSLASTTPNRSSHLPPPFLLRCLRKKGDAAYGLFNSPLHFDVGGHHNSDMSQRRFQGSNLEPEAKNNDIWKLFEEAQQNILYLNKQRLLAIEELNAVNKEKQSLLQRIDQLEAEKDASMGKDKHSFYWELLLRIDSMVLTGMINAAEASDMRKMVMGYKFSATDIFFDVMQKGDAELLAEFRRFSDESKMNGLHILHICTEMAPLVEVGSLASYVTGISHALQRKGHTVEVILPKYACLDLTEIQGLQEIGAESYSYFNGQLHGNKIWTGVFYGIGVTLIEPLYYSSFFNRERVYGYADDFDRFTYFSRASLDYIAKSGKQPDVLHLHNWETAIVGPLFWDIFVKQGLGGTRLLLTCHDFDSQCLEQPDKLALCGLDPTRLHRPDRLQDNSKTHLTNVLKGGIVYSNKVVILSSTHSKGRIICSFSHGLEPTLAIHKDKLVLSPCGFDKSAWDPSKDKLLPENYSAEDMKGKNVCKIALQKHLGFPKSSSVIIVGCIFSELSDFDLENLKAAIWNATRKDLQFVFMGSKMQSVNKALESLQKDLKRENVSVVGKYDDALAHLMFAAADIILCQSFHDPQLQVPVKALKYGAAPIAVTSSENRFRHLVDHDHEETTEFAQFISSTFGNMSLNQALDKITNNPSKWKQKIVEAMKKDFSWDGECCDILVSAYRDIKKL